jgi:hypothetical protein
MDKNFGPLWGGLSYIPSSLVQQHRHVLVVAHSAPVPRAAQGRCWALRRTAACRDKDYTSTYLYHLNLTARFISQTMEWSTQKLGLLSGYRNNDVLKPYKNLRLDRFGGIRSTSVYHLRIGCSREVAPPFLRYSTNQWENVWASSTIGFWPTVSIVAHTSLLDSAGDVGFNYLGFEFWATHIHGDLIQRNGDTNYDPSKYKCAQSPSKKLLMKPRLLVTICYMKIYDPGNPGCHSAPGRLRIQCFL